MLKLLVAMMMRGGVTYPTLDPANKGATVTLSGGNLNASFAAATVQNVRGTVAVAAAAHKYWEVTIGANGATLGVGVETGAANLNSFITAAGACYLNDGRIVLDASTLSTKATYTTGDVIGVEIDTSAATIKFYKNSTLQDTISSLPSNHSYPALGQNAAGAIADATINFGPTMVYGLPSGASLLTN